MTKNKQLKHLDTHITAEDVEKWQELERDWSLKTREEKAEQLRKNLELCKKFIREEGRQHEYNMGAIVEYIN